MILKLRRFTVPLPANHYSQPTSWYRGIIDTGDCDDNENENEHTTDQAVENENTVNLTSQS